MTGRRTLNAGCRSRIARVRLSPGAGFTLIEILLAVAIMASITAITFLTFSTVTKAWRRGQSLADDLHHGDFVMDQLVMGLRSAYYPETIKSGGLYGFTMEDDGDDAGSSDRISWVKLGGALVGTQSPIAGSPHRVEFHVDEDEDGEPAAAVRYWSVQGQPEDFSPDDVEPVFIAKRVTGFNCRMKDPESEDLAADEEIEWVDKWEDTNRVPRMVEVTLWLEPLAEGDPPLELKRIVEIPTAHLSWTGTSSGSSPGPSSGAPSGRSSGSSANRNTPGSTTPTLTMPVP